MSKFKPHGFHCVSNFGGWEIELSDCGDSARIRDSHSNEKSKWKEIKYTLKKGKAYVKAFKRKHKIQNFIRIGY